ncbi:hypothetical protein ACJMK2_026952 [Sinanodonta woodiana]|uniref:Tetraspanin n=1 Tax=Sinanodonta woodiana TaxID=1069815 RepID=A0ABD3XN18_SINWO
MCSGVQLYFNRILYLITFNAIGLALMIASCIIRYDRKTADTYLDFSSFQTALQSAKVSIPNSMDIGATIDPIFIALIVVGAIFLVIGVMGLIGSIRKVKALLVTYAVGLLVLVLMQSVSAVLVATIPEKIENWIKESLKDSIRNDYTGIGGNDTVTLRWNYIMHSFKCCGVDSYTDFVLLEAKRWNRNFAIDNIIQKKRVPFACCINKTDTNCVRNPTNSSAFTEKGCYQILKSWVVNKLNVLIGVGVRILAVQVILTVIAFMMCCTSRKRVDDNDDDDDDKTRRQPNRISHAQLMPRDTNLFYPDSVTRNPAYEGPRWHGSSLAIYQPHPWKETANHYHKPPDTVYNSYYYRETRSVP